MFLEKIVKFLFGRPQKKLVMFSIDLIINNNIKYFDQSQLNTFVKLIIQDGGCVNTAHVIF